MKKNTRRGGFYYSNELWDSDAYQSLSISARNLLHCMTIELRWTGKGKNKMWTNNGDLSFTEIQFKNQYEVCSSTYLNARDKLIEVGLIKQTYRGGMCRGDMAKYKLLFLKDIFPSEERWKKYPEENWAHEIPKRKKQLVGVTTQWKKGQSGRKTKATLQK